MGSNDDWLVWVADNLSRGAKEADLLVALQTNGISTPEVLIDRVKADPLFRLVSQQRGQLNRWSELMRDLEELEASSGSEYKLNCHSIESDFDFVGQYVSKNRPVVIDNWVSSWPCYSEWSFDNLEQRLGDTIIKYQDRSGLTSHLDTFSDNTVEGSFSEFLRLVRTGERDVYLIAHDKAFERIAFRELLDQIPTSPKLLRERPQDRRTFLWIGANGATTHMHRDLNNGIVAQVCGRRRFSLVPSRQMDLIYNTSGFVSDVDFRNPNCDVFPDLKRATILNGVLEPGQALFLPLGWWHYFEALEPTFSLTFANVRRDTRS